MRAYWDAQDRHRETSIRELARLIPEGCVAAILELNETPRMAVHAFRDADSNDLDPTEFEGFDQIDDVAMQLDFADWEGADSWLMRDTVLGDEYFIITRDVLNTPAADEIAPEEGSTEDNSRECRECGEHVGTLSTREWCDGCEEYDATHPACPNCGEHVEASELDVPEGDWIACDSCYHNARRSGWNG
ncbi:hypothetical protein ACFWGP_05465 [Agromyces sp. NPDC127015]|uniref:hypothetical protein n=1 Tax=Agromyces sp. NPDC127015 TaxID=3347108 RepID=UPI00365A1212